MGIIKDENEDKIEKDEEKGSEIAHVGGPGGPGGPGDPSKRWGAKPPTVWEGLPGPRGRPDPQNGRFPIRIKINNFSQSAATNNKDENEDNIEKQQERKDDRHNVQWLVRAPTGTASRGRGRGRNRRLRWLCGGLSGDVRKTSL